MNIKEKINLVYIDDDRDEAISAYLEEVYKNDKYDVEYHEIEFEGDKGYESLLDSPEVASANVILIDSRLFENDNIKCKGKFSGEEFRMILRKVFPFIEVLVISQNGENKDFEIIPKYKSGSSETSKEYYNRVLKNKIDESIKRVVTFRNIILNSSPENFPLHFILSFSNNLESISITFADVTFGESSKLS